MAANGSGPAVPPRTLECMESDPKVGIGMVDGRKGLSHLNAYPQLLVHLPAQALLKGLIWSSRTSRKLPQTAKETLVGPLNNEHPSPIILDNSGCHLFVGEGFSLPHDRQYFLQSLLEGEAEVPDGTGMTLRIPRLADSGPKLHDPVIEIGRVFGGDDLCCQIMDLSLGTALINGPLDSVQTAQDPLCIAVHSRESLVKGETQDGSGGILSDTWQTNEFIPGVGNLTPQSFHNLLSCSVQMARPGIVAHILPCFQHLLKRCLCQRLNGRELLQESVVVWNDCVHLGLLEHDL